MKMFRLNIGDNELENEHSIDGYCCTEMKYFFESRHYPIRYNKQFRSTLLISRIGPISISCDYCPFCGDAIRDGDDLGVKC